MVYHIQQILIKESSVLFNRLDPHKVNICDLDIKFDGLFGSGIIDFNKDN